MRWSLRLLVSFALLLGLALPAAAQPAPAPPTTSPADLRRLLDGVVATGAPGAIGSVEGDGATIRRVSGVGNLAPASRPARSRPSGWPARPRRSWLPWSSSWSPAARSVSTTR